MAKFAEGIRHQLDGSGLEGQIDLLPCHQPLADYVVFVRQQGPDVEACLVLRCPATPWKGRWRLGLTLSHIADA